MSLKNVLRMAASQFVEIPATEETRPNSAPIDGAPDLDELLKVLPKEQKAQRSVMELAEQTPGPNLDQITVSSGVIPEGGAVEFLSVYSSAGIAPISYTAEQMLEMLASLPKELPLTTKRQLVEAFLKSVGGSLGASPETIIADASRKIVALTAYEESCQAKTTTDVTAAQERIAALEAQLETERQAILDSQTRQSLLIAACDDEVARLENVTTFFGVAHPDAPPATAIPATVPAATQPESIMDKIKNITQQ